METIPAKQICLRAAAVLCACLLGACSLQSTHPPMPEALEYLQSDNAVSFAEVPVDAWDGAPYYVFQPASGTPSVGLVFYGGSQVDPRGYAPPAYELAAQGFLVALVSMPRDIAMLAPERAAQVIADFPDIDIWAVGGHSMGGIAASDFIDDNLDTVDAVALWASKPTEDNRLDGVDIAALSIYASEDGIYPAEVIDESRQHLPPDTVYVEIRGGNHFQFGWYLDDHQPVDGEATITREEQQEEIIAATATFLEEL